MRRIPEHAFGAADRAELDRHLRRMRVEGRLQAAIVQARIKSREDLLRDPGVAELARSAPRAREDLLKILTPPKDDPVPAALGVPIESASRVHQPSGMVLGRTRDHAAARYAVSDGRGEIISAGFIGRDPDFASVRFFGHRPWDLVNLPKDTRRQLAMRLVGPLRSTLRRLWRDADLGAADQPYRVLAAMAGYGAGLMGGPLVDGGGSLVSDGELVPPGDGDVAPPTDEGTPDGEIKPGDCANGCGPEGEFLDIELESLIPDGNWAECCNEHDRCYCPETADCGACHRAECDFKLLECMTQRTGWGIAAIYYFMVRALGGLGPYECEDDPVGLGGLIAVGAGVAIGIAAAEATGSYIVGLAAAVVATALLSRFLCEICEPIHQWREDIQETIEALIDFRRFREAVKRCRRRRNWWRRQWCKFKAIIKYIWRWIIAIVLLPQLIVLWVLELIACG